MINFYAYSPAALQAQQLRRGTFYHFSLFSNMWSPTVSELIFDKNWECRCYLGIVEYISIAVNVEPLPAMRPCSSNSFNYECKVSICMALCPRSRIIFILNQHQIILNFYFVVCGATTFSTTALNKMAFGWHCRVLLLYAEWHGALIVTSD